MNWYYSVEGQAMGPVEEAALEGLARSGEVSKDTLVWQPAMEAWETLQAQHPALLERVRLPGRQAKAEDAPLVGQAPAETPPPKAETVKEKTGLFGRLFGR